MPQARFTGILLGCSLQQGAGASESAPSAPAEEALSGGATTVFENGRESFALPLRNLSQENRRGFAVGNSFFNENWVSAPASTAGRDGLGPLFNANSCSTCHFKDGRGTPPLNPNDPIVSMIFRLSSAAPDGTLQNEPNYGEQFQNRSNPGIAAEGQVTIKYEEEPGAYADGTTYTLRKPSYHFADLTYGELSSSTLVSPRVSPQVYGLGLLAAIPEADLLSHADPDDSDRDGVSGRANHVWDIRGKKLALGRFGWKANQPSLEQQNAAAFANDLGITSHIFPKHTHTPVQMAAAGAPSGGNPEVDEKKLARVTLYTQTLAVPAHRNVDDPEVLRGKELFQQARCATCHVDTFRTGDFSDVPELANQTIHPYTDLLLHDMGPDLADNRPDGEATGSEWRTPPLWGIGLIKTVNGHTNLLHDGRARSMEEAILWHAGEATAARDHFKTMPAPDRAALLKFLDSL